MATSKATSSKIDASVIPADPCDLDFCIAKFAAVYLHYALCLDFSS